MSERRVLVIGSGGYLGRPVMDHLRGLGVQPIGADVMPVPTYVDHLLDMRFPEQSLALLLKIRPEVVISLAYLLTAASMASPHNAVHTNILGINGVFDACAQLEVPRVLFASSNTVYGDQSDFGSSDVTEDSPKRPRSLYGSMKLFNEVMGQHYTKAAPTRIVSVRLSSLHGRGKGGIFNPFDLVVDAARKGQAVTLPWSRLHEFSFLHVEDAAEIFARLAVAPAVASEVYDSGGEHMTMERLGRAASDVCGVTVAFDEPGRHIDHLSRISGSRLRAEFGIERRPMADWLAAEVRA